MLGLVIRPEQQPDKAQHPFLVGRERGQTEAAVLLAVTHLLGRAGQGAQRSSVVGDVAYPQMAFTFRGRMQFSHGLGHQVVTGHTEAITQALQDAMQAQEKGVGRPQLAAAVTKSLQKGGQG